jgi:hypothetical protein
LTIYPAGIGRVHIHFKVRTNAAGAYEFPSQLFFDEALNDQVLAQPPYAARGNATRSTRGPLYWRPAARRKPDGRQLPTFNIGLDLSDAGVGWLSVSTLKRERGERQMMQRVFRAGIVSSSSCPMRPLRHWGWRKAAR